MQHFLRFWGLQAPVESSRVRWPGHLCSRSCRIIRGWTEMESISFCFLWNVFSSPVLSQPRASVPGFCVPGQTGGSHIRFALHTYIQQKRKRRHRVRDSIWFSITGGPTPFIYTLAKLIDCFPEKNIIFQNFYFKLLNQYFISKQKDIYKMLAFWNWWKYTTFYFVKEEADKN